MAFKDTISRVKSNLREGKFQNEASVANGAVLSILNDLEWPVLDPTVVTPELSVPMVTEGGTHRKPDYALIGPDGRALTFFEIKAVNRAGTGEFQLFEQCFHAGVHFGVLTNGQEWHFYLTMGQGSYEDRKAYKLDLLIHDDDECCFRLERYLSYQNVISGSNLDFARKDLTDANRSTQIERFLPQALAQLLADPDDDLCKLLADKVSDLCGFTPDTDVCFAFLRANSSRVSGHPLSQMDQSPRPHTAQAAVPQPRSGRDVPSYFYGDQWFTRSTNTGVMVDLFNKLSAEYPTFLERYNARKQGRRNRFLSQDIYELYPEDHDRCERMNAELDMGGWFVATNQGQAGIERSIKLACEVLGLEYDRDIVVELRSQT